MNSPFAGVSAARTGVDETVTCVDATAEPSVSEWPRCARRSRWPLRPMTPQSPFSHLPPIPP
jgi:hypothetical protein